MRFRRLLSLLIALVWLSALAGAQTPLESILRGKRTTQIRLGNTPIPVAQDAVLFFGGLHGAERFDDPRIFRHRDFLLLQNDTLSTFPLTYPGSGSMSNLAFCQDSVLYLGGGRDSNMATYSSADFWRCDLRTHQWTRLGDIPFRYRHDAYCFYAAGKDTLLALVKGIYFEAEKTFHYPVLFAYLPREDKWQELSGLPGTELLSFVAFEDAANWYILFDMEVYAFQPSGKFYSISKKDFKWTQRKDYPKKSRMIGYAFSEDGYGYVGGGDTESGMLDNTLDRYDPATDTCTQIKTVYPFRNSRAWKYRGTWYNGFGFTGQYFSEGKSTIRKIFP